MGAAERLSELGVRPDAATGASSGSVIAAALASGRGADLRAVWLEVSAEARYFQPRRVLRGRWPLTMSHILREALERWLTGARLSDAEIPLGISVTRLTPRGPRHQLLTAAEDAPIVEAVLGSCFIPGPYSRPVWVAGGLAVDGAWLLRVPAEGALGLGADRVIAFVVQPSGALIGGMFRRRSHPWPEATRALTPVSPLPLQGFDFDLERHRAAIQIGRESAEVFLRENEAWLAG